MAVKIYNVGFNAVKISEKFTLPDDIQAFDGSELIYRFERLSTSYANPNNTAGYAELSSNSGDNYYYRLSDTGDATGTVVDISNVNEIDLTFNLQRFNYATSYRFWVDLGDIVRFFWLRDGSTGETGDLDLYTLVGTPQSYPILNGTTLFNENTYRILINTSGTKVFVGGVEQVNVPSYTIYTVKASITTTTLDAHVGSNRIQISNIDWKFN